MTTWTQWLNQPVPENIPHFIKSVEVPEPDPDLESKWKAKLNSIIEQNMKSGFFNKKDEVKIQIALEYAMADEAKRKELNQRYAIFQRPTAKLKLPDFGNVQMSDQQIEDSVLGILDLATGKKTEMGLPTKEV